MKAVLIANFGGPKVLRDLAWMLESEDCPLAARRRLDEVSLDEWAALIAAGRRPTCGWWRRNLIDSPHYVRGAGAE